MIQSAYLKVNDNLFYKITDSKCISVNTEKKSIKQVENIPSASMSNVKIITEDEFNNAKNSIEV